MSYIGEKTWFQNLNANSSYGYGTVLEEYKHEDKLYLVFSCEINGGLRAASEEDIVIKPTKTMHNKYFHAKKELGDVLKRK
jgi:hypothetical protein